MSVGVYHSVNDYSVPAISKYNVFLLAQQVV